MNFEKCKNSPLFVLSHDLPLQRNNRDRLYLSSDRPPKNLKPAHRKNVEHLDNTLSKRYFERRLSRKHQAALIFFLLRQEELRNEPSNQTLFPRRRSLFDNLDMVYKLRLSRPKFWSKNRNSSFSLLFQLCASRSDVIAGTPDNSMNMHKPINGKNVE